MNKTMEPKRYKVLYREISYRHTFVMAKNAKEAKRIVKDPKSNLASISRGLWFKQTCYAVRQREDQ
jgi:hypothetical protein